MNRIGGLEYVKSEFQSVRKTLVANTDKVKSENRSRFCFDDLKILGTMVEYKSEKVLDHSFGQNTMSKKYSIN